MTCEFNFSKDVLPGNPIKQWIYAAYNDEEDNWEFLNTDREFRDELRQSDRISFTPVGLFVGCCFDDVFNADYSICSAEEAYNFNKNLAEKIAYGRATNGLTRKKRAMSRVNPDLAELYLNFIERCERYYKAAHPSDRVVKAKKMCNEIIFQNSCDEDCEGDCEFCEHNCFDNKYDVYERIAEGNLEE